MEKSDLLKYRNFERWMKLKFLKCEIWEYFSSMFPAMQIDLNQDLNLLEVTNLELKEEV